MFPQTCIPKYLCDEHVINRLVGLLHGACDHHALARCQPAGLDNDGRTKRANEIFGTLGISEDLVCCSWDVIPLEDVLQVHGRDGMHEAKAYTVA